MASSVEKWVGLGSAMAGFGLLWSRLPERVHNEARNIITSWSPMLAAYLNPYEQIIIPQYTDNEQFRPNELFDLATAYLNRACMIAGHKLNAEIGSNGQDNTLTVFRLAGNQEVVDSFGNTRMWWNLSVDEHREHRLKLVLVFHTRHRQLVQSSLSRDDTEGDGRRHQVEDRPSEYTILDFSTWYQSLRD